EGLDVEIRAGAPVCVVEHTFTHVRATYHAIRCAVIDGDPRPLLYDEVAWIPWARVADYALPVAQRRIAALAAEPTLFTPPAMSG
ncbi:MAG TPA: hypothetical protein VEY93_09330, partial [Longimicrobium sp.]|nr:hypothetical protein [Longimicrobium sp.]